MKWLWIVPLGFIAIILLFVHPLLGLLAIGLVGASWLGYHICSLPEHVMSLPEHIMSYWRRRYARGWSTTRKRRLAERKRRKPLTSLMPAIVLENAIGAWRRYAAMRRYAAIMGSEQSEARCAYIRRPMAVTLGAGQSGVQLTWGGNPVPLPQSRPASAP